MYSLTELLASETFRKRPPMYCGWSEFKVVGHWLRGIEIGIQMADRRYESPA